MMIRLIHTADLHLDSPLKSLALRDPDLSAVVQSATRSALSTIVDTAVSMEAKGLLVSGDLFDGAVHSAQTRAFLLAELDRLGEAGVRVFYIKGNHDALSPFAKATILPSNVHVFDKRGGKEELVPDVWIHGVSFPDPAVNESLLPSFHPPVEDAVNIAMLHTSLGGANGHDDYAPCSVADLRGMGFDYWALGHIHRREVHSTSPWIVMPGMPQGRDIGEAGPKSATLLTIEDGVVAVEEIPTSQIEFLTVEVDIAGEDSDESARRRIREALDSVAAELRSPCGAIRAKIVGTAEQRWQFLRDGDLWTEIVAECARATEKLWLEKTEFVLNESAPVPPDPGAIGALEGLMGEISREDGFAKSASGRLHEVLSSFPSQVQKSLVPAKEDEAALVGALVKDGIEHVLAQMRGANAL